MKQTPIGFRFGRILGSFGMILVNLKMIRHMLENDPQFLAPEHRHLYLEAENAIYRLRSALKMKAPDSDDK